jgi:hypothetical protein
MTSGKRDTSISEKLAKQIVLKDSSEIENFEMRP